MKKQNPDDETANRLIEEWKEDTKVIMKADFITPLEKIFEDRLREFCFKSIEEGKAQQPVCLGCGIRVADECGICIRKKLDQQKKEVLKLLENNWIWSNNQDYQPYAKAIKVVKLEELKKQLESKDYSVDKKTERLYNEAKEKSKKTGEYF